MSSRSIQESSSVWTRVMVTLALSPANTRIVLPVRPVPGVGESTVMQTSSSLSAAATMSSAATLACPSSPAMRTDALACSPRLASMTRAVPATSRRNAVASPPMPMSNMRARSLEASTSSTPCWYAESDVPPSFSACSSV